MPQVFEPNERTRRGIEQQPSQTLGESAISGLIRYGVIGANTTLPAFNSGYLKNLLLQEMNRQIANPYAAEWRQAGQKAISAQTRQALEFLKQQSAVSGFRGFVDPNAVQRIYEQGSIASQQIERDIQATSLDLMKTQLAYRESAIGKLLGLEQAQAQFNLQRDMGLLDLFSRTRENQLNRDFQWRMLLEQINQQERAGIGSIIGGLLQGAATGGVYALLKGV